MAATGVLTPTPAGRSGRRHRRWLWFAFGAVALVVAGSTQYRPAVVDGFAVDWP